MSENARICIHDGPLADSTLLWLVGATEVSELLDMIEEAFEDNEPFAGGNIIPVFMAEMFEDLEAVKRLCKMDNVMLFSQSGEIKRVVL